MFHVGLVRAKATGYWWDQQLWGGDPAGQSDCAVVAVSHGGCTCLLKVPPVLPYVSAFSRTSCSVEAVEVLGAADCCQLRTYVVACHAPRLFMADTRNHHSYNYLNFV